MNKTIILIAPVRALSSFGDLPAKTINFIESKGYKVVLPPNASKYKDDLSAGGIFSSLSAKSRAEDFNWAFAQNPLAIISFVGGYNSNEILSLIDLDVVSRSSSRFIHHSDTTVLGNAMWAMSGKKNWYGISGINFTVDATKQETWRSLEKLLDNHLSEIEPLKSFQDEFDSELEVSSGWSVIQPGEAQGIGIGGNIGTISLLQGTKYMPKFRRPTILFIEDDDLSGEDTLFQFKRYLLSLIMQEGASENIKGILIGRFNKSTNIDSKKIGLAIKALSDIEPWLAKIPIISGVEFDHSLPKTLLPIGGEIKFNTSERKIYII